MIQICRKSTFVLLVSLIVFPASLFADPLTYQGQPIANLPRIELAGVTAGASGAARPAASAFGQYVYGGRRHRNDAAMTAILIGAAAAIAGTAVLVYANRPDCSVNAEFGGCGYGTKVVGGSLLAGGLVGVIVGAATWR